VFLFANIQDVINEEIIVRTSRLVVAMEVNFYCRSESYYKFTQINSLPTKLLLGIPSALFAQQQKPPIMGWSSRNHFRVNINEKMVREQADAMKSSGMYDAGRQPNQTVNNMRQ